MISRACGNPERNMGLVERKPVISVSTWLCSNWSALLQRRARILNTEILWMHRLGCAFVVCM